MSIRYLPARHIEASKEKILSIVDFLYKNPETSFNEHKASDFLTSMLKEEGFSVERDIYDIKNSFKAVYGSKSPTIAYICEYDALPGIGHGSGHNIASAMNIGAALGLKGVIDDIGGRVMVLGCPSEERIPTKIDMLNKGAFKDVDAVICGHPWDKTCESGSSLGMAVIRIEFKGHEAHTSINFKEGVNALSPCITLFNLIETLRARYAVDSFINGIISHGGKLINLIPGEAECMFMIKSINSNKVDEIIDSLIHCAEFSCKIHNCSMEYSYPEPKYLPLKTHEELSKIMSHNLKENGIIDIHGPITIPEALDIGNISHKLPTAAPYVGICSEGVRYYTSEFNQCTIGDYAKDRMLKGACALALTGMDIIQKPDIL